jgi:hypothetical protein
MANHLKWNFSTHTLCVSSFGCSYVLCIPFDVSSRHGESPMMTIVVRKLFCQVKCCFWLESICATTPREQSKQESAGTVNTISHSQAFLISSKQNKTESVRTAGRTPRIRVM